MSEIMITTNHLTKRYGGLLAVSDVSLSIEKGSIVGLIGKNGAGKTTLIRLLTGLAKPTQGTFELMPGRVREDTSVAAIVERPSIYLDMSSMDNLIAQCLLLNITPDKEYLEKTLRLVGLSPNSTQKAKNYSLGMKQRLAIALTLVGKPELLILDEPTNGLDPKGIHDMREVFLNLNKEFGTTIIISSHILSELGKVATEFFFMDRGRIIKHATAAELENMSTKCIKLTVDNTEKAAEILAKYGEVTTNGNVVELSSETPVTQMLLELAQAKVVVSNVANTSDSLEDVFIRLVGGAK